MGAHLRGPAPMATELTFEAFDIFLEN